MRPPEDRLTALAPRPVTLEQTGLTLEFVADLVLKLLLQLGVSRASALSDRVALAGTVLERVLHFLRKEGNVEVRPRPSGDNDLHFGLTIKGRAAAVDAMGRSGYVGPAPVPLAKYADIVSAQSVHRVGVTARSMREAFENIVLSDSQRDRLGAALNSGRAIFIYGAPGTGKTYIAKQLERALPGAVLVPYAVLVNETVVEIFDPSAHLALELASEPPRFSLAEGFDPRFVLSERPMVVTAGELSADMLEVRYEASTRRFIAPVQLKANNGILIVDDLGRQRLPVEVLFNRWIVPLEEKIDYLTAGNGTHFEVPFDVVLVLATNLEPHELADDAFLRRIGYKVEFRPVPAEDYRRIWREVCGKQGVTYDPMVVDFVLHDLHGRHGVPLLPCHPRDLLGMALDRAAYLGIPADDLDTEALSWAWDNYFLSDAKGKGGAADAPRSPLLASPR